MAVIADDRIGAVLDHQPREVALAGQRALLGLAQPAVAFLERVGHRVERGAEPAELGPPIADRHARVEIAARPAADAVEQHCGRTPDDPPADRQHRDDDEQRRQRDQAEAAPQRAVEIGSQRRLVESDAGEDADRRHRRRNETDQPLLAVVARHHGIAGCRRVDVRHRARQELLARPLLVIGIAREHGAGAVGDDDRAVLRPFEVGEMAAEPIEVEADRNDAAHASAVLASDRICERKIAAAGNRSASIAAGDEFARAERLRDLRRGLEVIRRGGDAGAFETAARIIEADVLERSQRVADFRKAVRAAGIGSLDAAVARDRRRELACAVDDAEHVGIDQLGLVERAGRDLPPALGPEVELVVHLDRDGRHEAEQHEQEQA